MQITQMSFTEKQDAPHWVIEWRRKDDRRPTIAKRRSEAEAIKRADELRNTHNARVDVWRDEGDCRHLVYVAERLR